MTTLISFLGKGAPGQNGYRTAHYEMQPGVVVEGPYFGLLCARHIGASRLVLLGTRESMWDVFFQQDVQDDEALALMEAVASGEVDDDLLERNARRLEARIGFTVDCMLIPYAQDENEQASVLRLLADRLSPREEVAIDVTHAFRHLPMLALVAARYLTRVRSIRIRDIYYGALSMEDPCTGLTPVLRLGGLLRLLDWTDALAAFDATANPRSLVELLSVAAPQVAERLEESSFHEGINIITKARGPARKARELLSRTIADAGADLFREVLVDRLQWVDGNRLADRQYRLAHLHLEHGDFVRASILSYEAALTALVQRENEDPENYDARERVEAQYRDERSYGYDRSRRDVRFAYRDLKDVRNAIAHGARPRRAEIASALSSAPSLEAFLLEKLELVFSALNRQG